MPLSSARNQSLDVLRCFAVLLTMGRHLPDSAILHRAGWMGVELFFVLSGYLISGLLFNEYNATGGIKVGRFLLRRGFKIWPPFYFLIFGTISLFAIFRFKFSWFGVAMNCAFLQNYFYAGPRSGGLLLYHTWSLAVEEHFYILLPLFLSALIFLAKFSAKPEKPFRWIPGTLLMLLALCAYLRWHSGLTYDVVYPRTEMNLDSLFAGVTLRYLQSFHASAFQKIAAWPAILIATACCLPGFFMEANSPWFQTIGGTVMIAGFVSLIAWSVTRNPSRLFGKMGAGFLAAIGGYSYSIYLWHILFATFFSVMHPSPWRFLIYVATATVFGAAMGEIVEKPSLLLREKLMSSSRRTPVPAAAIARPA